MGFNFREAKSEDEWQHFIQSSEAATIFHDKSYLDSLGCSYQLYFVCKGDDPKLGIVAPLSKDKSSIIQVPYHIYNGICFKGDDPKNPQSLQKKLSDQFSLTEFFVEQITQRFHDISFSLSPDIRDLRPFQWHNYHNSKDAHFETHVRYTSMLDVTELSKPLQNEEDYSVFKNLSMSRRQEVRYGRKDSIQAIPSSDTNELFDLIQIYNSQRTDNPKTIQIEFERLSAAVTELEKSGKGRLFIVKNQEHQIVSTSYFGLFRNKAYYLYGANHPDCKDRYSGTLALWDAFLHLAQHDNINSIDLEGVNSPSRGWFKLSFGGNLIPYYKVTLKN